MEDFYYAGGLPALLQRIRGAPAHRRADRQRPHAGREHRRRRGLRRRRDPAAGQPDLCRRRAGRAARQPGARRRGHQAQRLRAAPAAAHRPRAGLRRLSVAEEGGRRPRPGRHGRRHPGAAQRRPAGRRHARVGHAADPDQAAEGRRDRHAAPERCAHERHQLRRLHAALRARGVRSAGRWRWCAAATASASTCRRGASTSRSATPNWPRAAPPGQPPPPRYERGYGWIFGRTSCRPTRAATSTSSRPASARRWPSRTSTEAKGGACRRWC